MGIWIIRLFWGISAKSRDCSREKEELIAFLAGVDARVANIVKRLAARKRREPKTEAVCWRTEEHAVTT